jgi:hypothetical protein
MTIYCDQQRRDVLGSGGAPSLTPADTQKLMASQFPQSE